MLAIQYSKQQQSQCWMTKAITVKITGKQLTLRPDHQIIQRNLRSMEESCNITLKVNKKYKKHSSSDGYMILLTSFQPTQFGGKLHSSKESSSS